MLEWRKIVEDWEFSGELAVLGLWADYKGLNIDFVGDFNQLLRCYEDEYLGRSETVADAVHHQYMKRHDTLIKNLPYCIRTAINWELVAEKHSEDYFYYGGHLFWNRHTMKLL